VQRLNFSADATEGIVGPLRHRCTVAQRAELSDSERALIVRVRNTRAICGHFGGDAIERVIADRRQLATAVELRAQIAKVVVGVLRGTGVRRGELREISQAVVRVLREEPARVGDAEQAVDSIVSVADDPVRGVGDLREAVARVVLLRAAATEGIEGREQVADVVVAVPRNLARGIDTADCLLQSVQ